MQDSAAAATPQREAGAMLSTSPSENHERGNLRSYAWNLSGRRSVKLSKGLIIRAWIDGREKASAVIKEPDTAELHESWEAATQQS